MIENRDGYDLDELKRSIINEQEFSQKKTAVLVSSPYSKEHSCKVSSKSLERFSRKIVH